MNKKTTFSAKVTLIIFLYISLCSGILQAQMRVGQPSGSPHSSAALDVSGGPYQLGSPYRGILPPKVALSQTTSPAPIINPAIGLLIYNTIKVGDVIPGYYYWEGSKWVLFETSAKGSARLAAADSLATKKQLSDSVAIRLRVLTSITDFTTATQAVVLHPDGGLCVKVTGTVSSTTPGYGYTMFLALGNNHYERQITSNTVKAKWFLAKGDSTTNNQSAFEKIIAFCRPGWTIEIDEAGIYLLDGIVITKPIRIIGNGVTLKQRMGVNKPIIAIQSSSVSINGNITLYGNKTNQDPDSVNTTNRYGIQTIHGLNNIDIRDIVIQNTHNAGLCLQGTSVAWIDKVRFINCNQPGNNKAIIVRSELSNSSDIKITDCYLDQRLSKNGGMTITSAFNAYSTRRITVTGNTVLMGELEGEALGIEFYCGYDADHSGTISDVVANNNIVQCLAVGNDGVRDKNYYAYGISFGGEAQIAGKGIYNITANGNTIQGCRRLSIELNASNVAAVGNVIENSAEMSANSSTILGGLTGLNMSANTFRNVGGYNGIYQLRLNAGANPIRNAVISNNIFYDGLPGTDNITLTGGTNNVSGQAQFINVSIDNNVGYSVPRYGLYMQEKAELINVSVSKQQFHIISDSNKRGIYFTPRYAFNVSFSDLMIMGTDSTADMFGFLQVGGNNHTNISMKNSLISNIKRGFSYNGNTKGLQHINNSVTSAALYGLAINNSPTSVLYGGNSYRLCPQNETISATANILATYGTIGTVNNTVLSISPTSPTITIASDAITVTKNIHLIAPESGTQDNLSTISGGVANTIYVLYPSSNSYIITLKDGTGNLRLVSDFVMNHNSDRITLLFDGANFIELARSDNNSTSSTTTLTSTTATAVVNTTYIANNASLVAITLPTNTASTIGDWIEINGTGGAGFRILQPEANTIIYLGGNSTTAGTNGYVTASARTSVRLIKTAANVWQFTSSTGAPAFN